MNTPSTPSVSNLLDLSGQTALVTGAGGGVGQAIAHRLAEAGARVLLHARRDNETIRKLEQDLRASDKQAGVLFADLRDAEACATMIAGIEAGLDILVCNAAMQDMGLLAGPEGLATERVDDLLRVNVTAPGYLARAFAEKARKTTSVAGRSIINIASVEAMIPLAGHGHYAASKAALVMLTKALAQELGPLGIQVNAVSPGLVWRKGIENSWPDGVGRWVARVPLACPETAGRAPGVGAKLVQPHEVANAVLFLASAAGRFVNGHDLVVDGGMAALPAW